MVQIARERIDLLMREADLAALAGKMEHADRYVDIARRVGMRYNVRVPTTYRRRFCRGCYRYLQPGVSSRTRLSRGRVVTTCLSCGHVSRIPLGNRSMPGREDPPAEAMLPTDEG
jgi:ribonuclease P protein subunit RPR2